MSARHRGSTSRRRMVAVVLAAVLGRGYVGGHRLADAALGLAPVAAPVTALIGASRESIAPRLTVVPAPATAPAPTDTAPHPVVVLLPLDAAIDDSVTIDLRDVAVAGAYSARHIA